MDVLYRDGPAAVADVRAALDDPPGYSAVRAMLRVLEEKGHLRHERSGTRYLYRPTVTRERAKRSALAHVLDTFFEGSVSQAVAAMVEDPARELDAAELTRLRRLIDEAQKSGGR